MKIAFDINGTLKKTDESETQTMISFLKLLKKAGHFIIIWSGDDLDEIKRFIAEYHLESFIDSAISKLSASQDNLPDIAFDDSDFAYLAKVAVIKI